MIVRLVERPRQGVGEPPHARQQVNDLLAQVPGHPAPAWLLLTERFSFETIPTPTNPDREYFTGPRTVRCPLPNGVGN
jgi:hypothetical protein